MHGRRPGTYSIVAVDTATGEIGVAVQSKYSAWAPSCGRCGRASAPWRRRRRASPRTAPRALALLEHGLEPAAALERTLADDYRRETPSSAS